MSLAIITPVYGNADTLEALHDRIAASLPGGHWTLHLVIDACPAGSAAVAQRLAEAHPNVVVIHHDENRGQHAAIVTGLRAAWAQRYVVLDADLQDPPEAIPRLLEVMDAEPVAGVFAGRVPGYQSGGRTLTGALHRRLLAALTSLPPDAGAFFAMDGRLRTAILDAWDRRGAPSVVAAAGASRLPLTSVPVVRDQRPTGRSAWTSTARARQGLRTVYWAIAQRARSAGPTDSIPTDPSPLTPAERPFR